MSRSPFFFVERFNWKTKKYELQHPRVRYRNAEWTIADLFPYDACHELFSILEREEGRFPAMQGIHNGMPDGVAGEIEAAFRDCCYEESNEGDSTEERYCYTPKVRWFTYADMYIYCLKYPEVPKFDEMNSTTWYMPKVTIPLKALMNRVDIFLGLMDEWGLWRDDYSLIRIVYWIE